MKAAEPGGNGRMSGDRLGAGLGVGLAAFVVFEERACGAFGECVRLETGISREAAKSRRGAVVKGTGAVIRSGVFGWLMAAGPIERNFIPHSTTLARGLMSGNRLGGLVGCGFGRFLFWGEGLGAFGGCVILGLESRAKPRRREGGQGGRAILT